MYELMVIAKADGADGEVDKYLIDAMAENVNKQSLGKKQLAYPIKKISEAEYFLWTFEAPGSAILPLDTKMRLEQDLVLRHLLTVFDPKKAARLPKVQVTESQSGKEPEKVEKVAPKVTVTTKIVGVAKSPAVAKALAGRQSDKEPEESKSKVKVGSKVKSKGKK